MLHGLETPQQGRVKLRRLAQEPAERLANDMEMLPGFVSLGPLQRRREVRILT